VRNSGKVKERQKESKISISFRLSPVIRVRVLDRITPRTQKATELKNTTFIGLIGSKLHQGEIAVVTVKPANIVRERILCSRILFMDSNLTD
jgi:hypothetical protein